MRYGRELTYADENRSYALVEEFYCLAKEALPIPSYQDDGLSFRDLFMASTGTNVTYDSPHLVEPLVMFGVCAEMLARGFEPADGCDEFVAYIAGKTDLTPENLPNEIAYDAARRVGMALALLS